MSILLADPPLRVRFALSVDAQLCARTEDLSLRRPQGRNNPGWHQQKPLHRWCSSQ